MDCSYYLGYIHCLKHDSLTPSCLFWPSNVTLFKAYFPWTTCGCALSQGRVRDHPVHIWSDSRNIFTFLLWPSCHQHNNLDGLYRRSHSFIFLALSRSSKVRRLLMHYSAPRHSHYTSHSDDAKLGLNRSGTDWLSALGLLWFDSLLTGLDDFLFRS